MRIWSLERGRKRGGKTAEKGVVLGEAMGGGVVVLGCTIGGWAGTGEIISNGAISWTWNEKVVFAQESRGRCQYGNARCLIYIEN